MFPILLYGADHFTPTKGIHKKMHIHQHHVQRWVINCFRCISVLILSAELCCPPLVLILSHKPPMADLRLLCSPTTINPAELWLRRSFNCQLTSKVPEFPQALSSGLALYLMPVNWNTALPSPQVHTHLPVDGLWHLTIPPLKERSCIPPINFILLA